LSSSFFNGPIERAPPFVAQCPVLGRVHVPESVQVDADGIEPGFFQEAKVLSLETSLIRAAPEWVIADNVDAESCG